MRQMRKIYLAARLVVVWLWLEGTAQVALDFCKSIEEGNSSKKDFAEVDEVPYQMKLEACHDLFYGRAWLERMWVIQEVYHGNPVVVQIGP